MEGSQGPRLSVAALPLLELPDECLLLLIQLLGQQSKPALGTLARTHSKLLALALPVAVADVSKTLVTKKQLMRLYRHLQAQGHLARRLHLQGRPAVLDLDDPGSFGACGMGAPRIKALPDAAQPHLEALVINYLRVAPGKFLTPSLARLQALHISGCIVTDGGDSLEAALVAVAPSLRSLTIYRLFSPSEHKLRPVPFPNAALPALTALTRLQAGSLRSTAGLSGLVQLQDLAIQSNRGINIEAGDLPGTLTRLVLHNPVGKSLPLREAVPALDPAALSRVPALRHLLLNTHVQADGQEEGGTAGFLQALGTLTQLTLLSVQQGPLQQRLAPAAYASLTASSALQTLEVAETHHLPDGAWGHVFGRGRQLPQLRSLQLGKRCVRDPFLFKCRDQDTQPWAMAADDLAALAACCPGLTSLELCARQQGMPLAPLLTRLTALHTLLADATSDADAAALVQLSGLRELFLPGSSLCFGSIHGLSQLMRLEQLHVEAWPEAPAPGVSGTPCPTGRVTGSLLPEVWSFTNKAPAGCPPDVWHQLAAACGLRQEDAAAYRVWKKAEQSARMGSSMREMILWNSQGAGRGMTRAQAAAVRLVREGLKRTAARVGVFSSEVLVPVKWI